MKNMKDDTYVKEIIYLILDKSPATKQALLSIYISKGHF